MEVYDELASCSSGEEDDHDELASSSDCDEADEEDEDFEPSSVRKKAQACSAIAPLQKDRHDAKENKNPNFTDLLKDDEDGKKFTVEQCKDYLRKHGLRLSGAKAVLIERIKGHLQEQETNVKAELGGSNDSNDPVHGNLIEQFTKMDLNSVAINEFFKDVKKVTVEDCKAYLRKHGLRLAGTKQILVARIKEYLEIKDNQGPLKYPETSFIIDCKGDACVGDVVLFKQKVYDFFNVGGRCSAGPPVGIRTIAGRIVKESYGSAKQQHTFTVEVLWSTGERPLPPLHPLIIKGRNLYRVKTLRQAWDDETARTRKLREKHARGAAAREARRGRLQRIEDMGGTRNQTRQAASNSEKFSRKYETAMGHCPLLDDGGTTVVTVRDSACAQNAMIHPSHWNKTAVCAYQSVDKVHMTTAHPMSSNGQSSSRSSTAVYANQNVDKFHMTTTSRMMSRDVESYCSSVSLNASKLASVALPTATKLMLSTHVEPAVSVVELRFKSTLAGLIIGKEGAHCKEVRRISQAEISVEIDSANPALCIVKITGTAHQKEVAIQLVSQRTQCKFFAIKGKCSLGESCKFSHSLLGG